MKLCIAPLFSSSSGNATYIGTDSTGILVDAGLPGGVIDAALSQIDHLPIRAILITHEHSDHIRGAGVLSRRYDAPVYANEATWAQMEHKIGEISQKNIRVFEDDEFFVGDVLIRPIPIHHDAADPVGFALHAGGRKVALMTDTGIVTRDMLEAAAQANIVLLESNHDVTMLKTGRYSYSLKQRILSSKGHLSNDAAGEAALALVERGVKGILLGHLSRENNTEETAFAAVNSFLRENGVIRGRDVALAMTKKDAPTGCFVLPCGGMQ